MAVCLAMFPSLKWFHIGFESPRSRPDRIGRPPPTPAVLPVLMQFEFKGVSEYLEDLVVQIDTPNLVTLKIQLFMDFMFNIPQLSKFTVGHAIKLEIICREPDWRASSMVQVCSQLSRLLSHVEQIHIRD